MIGFPQLQQDLALQIQEAELDHAAFSRPLKLCELTQCRATCCHDGVYLDPEERRVIQDAITQHPQLLASYHWHEPEIFAAPQGRWKSVTHQDESKPENFPDHFPRTRCVFLDPEHRCVLQRLASDTGRHPWFWKPVSCWMHPLVLIPGKQTSRPRLTLAEPHNDPAASPGYPGFSAFTPCGMTCSKGDAAAVTLTMELDLLGQISGRNVLAELHADAAPETPPSSQEP